jgi:hypothetical protein
MNNVLNSMDTYSQNYDTLDTSDYTSDINDFYVNSDVSNNGIIPDVQDKSNFTYAKNGKIIYNSTQIDSIKGNYEQTLLTHNFFSDNNIKTIQDSIRYYVFQNTSKVIDYQSEQELITVMRGQLLQYGNMALNDRESVLREIHKLNKLVINFSVDRIISELNMYDFYLNDLSHLKVPIERPKYVNKNNKEEGHPYL